MNKVLKKTLKRVLGTRISAHFIVMAVDLTVIVIYIELSFTTAIR